MCRTPALLCTLENAGRFGGANPRSLTVSPDGSRILVSDPVASAPGYIDEFDRSGNYVANFADGWSPRFDDTGDVFWAVLDPGASPYENQIRYGPDDASDTFVWADPTGTGDPAQVIDFRWSAVDGMLYVLDGANPFAREIYRVNPSTGGATLLATSSGFSGPSSLILTGTIVVADDGAVWFTRVDSLLCRVDIGGTETQTSPSAGLVAIGCEPTTIIIRRTIAGVTHHYAIDPSFTITNEFGYDPPSGLNGWSDYDYDAAGRLYLLHSASREVWWVPPPSRRAWRVRHF